MSNFFSTGGNNNQKQVNIFKLSQETDGSRGNSLKGQYSELEKDYKQIFFEAAERIKRELEEFKPKNACEGCLNKECKIEKKDIFAPYPPAGCKYRDWQKQAITYLSGDYRIKLKAAYKDIMDKIAGYECNKCGACCKLAVNTYSYTQLKQRAMKGDKFSEDFVSVFVPYETEEEAKAVNPEYFELLNEVASDEKIYYYHCPKIDSNNKCTIYEKRPDICREFPHNPLKLLPSECSFNEWKKEVSYQAKLLKAKTDIIDFYKQKLG